MLRFLSAASPHRLCFDEVNLYRKEITSLRILFLLEFYVPNSGKYDLDFKTKDKGDSGHINGQELANLYKSFINEYPIVSLEDVFDQDDWSSWSNFMKDTKIQIVGDDLTVTNPKRMNTAIEKKACNCLLLKVNQIGSVTESIEAYVSLIINY